MNQLLRNSIRLVASLALATSLGCSTMSSRSGNASGAHSTLPAKHAVDQGSSTDHFPTAAEAGVS
ncbi:MAG TPA: hypothetical protein VFE24_05260 [Pirellulales bacterium]|jgi:hypothetical protein|nr:hypothetical protein [Pirellulales bacterium]